MTGGVYTITNSANDKRYIGSALNTRRRWSEHRSRLRKGCHENEKLQRAWNKYGEAAFVFAVIEIIESKPDQLIREQFWIDSTNAVASGYNLSTITSGGSGGARQGAARDNVISANKRRTGTKASLFTRELQSIAHTGRKHSAETLKKIGAGNKGKIISPENKAIISAAMTGNKICVGRKLSEETKAKISAGNILAAKRSRDKRERNLNGSD